MDKCMCKLDSLIEALNIFRKYGNPKYPTHCYRDELAINGIKPEDVSVEDKARLSLLGFEENEEEGYFYSFRFGSC